MFKKKYKKAFSLTVLSLVMFVTSGIATIALSQKTYAVVEEDCPDGFTVRFTPGTPGQEYADKCRNHQTGTAAPDDTETAPTFGGITITCSDGSKASAGSPDAAERICQGRAASPNAAKTPNFKGDCNATKIDQTNCGIIAYLLTFINLLSALVGLVVVIMIAVGGIQYSASRDNPQATQAAKTRIRNAILALVAYLFMYAFLQYIIPGGVL